MNDGLRKFEELLKNDTAFQEKLKAAMESYHGEKTEQAVFEGIIVPLANEYGISASFEEYREYIKKKQAQRIITKRIFLSQQSMVMKCPKKRWMNL